MIETKCPKCLKHTIEIDILAGKMRCLNINCLFTCDYDPSVDELLNQIHPINNKAVAIILKKLNDRVKKLEADRDNIGWPTD